MSDPVPELAYLVELAVERCTPTAIAGKSAAQGWPPQSRLVVVPCPKERYPEAEWQPGNGTTSCEGITPALSLDLGIGNYALGRVMQAQAGRSPPVIATKKHRKLATHCVAASHFKAAERCLERRRNLYIPGIKTYCDNSVVRARGQIRFESFA
jgi:hypothetical protein